MHTEYKGFTIESSSDGVTTSYFIPAFNSGHYKTLGNAKGAITKHLKSQEESREAQTASAIAVVEALAACPLRTITPEAIAGWTNQRNERGEPVHSDPRLAHIYAELDYFGMTKVRDSRSRNKREGKFTGRLDGGKKATRQGKRFISALAKAAFPVPSWNASAWQNSRYVSRKVGA